MEAGERCKNGTGKGEGGFESFDLKVDGEATRLMGVYVAGHDSACVSHHPAREHVIRNTLGHEN